MRLILLLLIITACTGLPRRDPAPAPIPEPKTIEQPQPKKEKPVTIITVNPPAKPQPICVPLAANERKLILQTLECLVKESEKPKK